MSSKKKLKKLVCELRTRHEIEREDNESLIREKSAALTDLINERTYANELRDEVKAHMQTIVTLKNENHDLKVECGYVVTQRTYYMQNYDRLVDEAEERKEYVSQLEYANGLLMNYLSDEHEAHELANNTIKNRDRQLAWSKDRDKLRINALKNALEGRDIFIKALESEIRSLKEQYGIARILGKYGISQ